MLKLIRINLSKGKESNHPDIKVGSKFTYLAKIGGQWTTGHFTKQWYGLNFQALYDAGIQFDTPGTNESDWEELYQLKGR